MKHIEVQKIEGTTEPMFNVSTNGIWRARVTIMVRDVVVVRGWLSAVEKDEVAKLILWRKI